MSYRNKYLKYKEKYINLKNQYGGNIDCNDLSTIGFHNILGTCWNITLLSIFLYGQKTKDRVYHKLINLTPEQIITDAKRHLELFLPNNLLDNNNLLLENTYITLVEFVNEIKLRFLNKLDQLNKDEHPDMPPTIKRQESHICEQNIVDKFFTLFTKKYKSNSGRINETYYLSNLLGIIFLNKFIDIHHFNLRNINNSHFFKLNGPKKNINIIEKIDLDLLDKSIGMELELDNRHIIDFINNYNYSGHSQGFFSCNNMKFIDNHNIIDYDYKKFIKTINEQTDRDFIIPYDNKANPTPTPSDSSSAASGSSESGVRGISNELIDDMSRISAIEKLNGMIVALWCKQY